MGYRNQTERTPACLVDLYEYIERNKGLCGNANPGDVRLSAGGTTLMITSDRTSFSSQDILLKRIEDDDQLRIKHIGVKSLAGGDKHPHIEVVAK